MADRSTRAKLAWYDSPRAGRLALITLDNGEDHRRPNVFGAQAIASLDATIDAIEAPGDCKGVLLTGKPFAFAAGADLAEFEQLAGDPELGRTAARRGQATFDRLRRLDVPTLAAINGVSLGGGLEIALYCDWRVVSTAARALGFPEVGLSLVPGWGGTQLVPRLAGVRGALEAIVRRPLDFGRTLKPAEACDLGLADQLLEAVDFLDASIALLERFVTGEERPQRPTVTDDEATIDAAVDEARRLAAQRVRAGTRAPALAIDLIEFAARGGDLAEGLAREQAAFGEMVASRQAQAAVYSFGLTQRRARKVPARPAVEPRPVGTVGIVGAGLMGAQLAALFLQRLEVPVVITDVDEAVLASARSHVEGELAKRVQRGRVSAGKGAFLESIVTYTTDTADLAGAGLVLEAVSEDLGLKQRVFGALEPIVEAGCVLATNTSSLSVTRMAEGLAHPERVVGLHFFNPPSVLPLVEVVRTERTDEATLATAFEVAGGLRKTVLLCADTPAFVVNRMLTRLGGAAFAALRHGNTVEEVDAAVKDLGLPMGPFELLGFVGIPVALHTAASLEAAYPERFAIDPGFRRLAELGVDGVYDWTGGAPAVRPEVAAAIQTDAGADPLAAEDVRRLVLEALADEARAMLSEGTVADARDIDTGLLLGAGFPAFMGGVCKHLDQTGVSERLFGEPLVGEHDRAAVPT